MGRLLRGALPLKGLLALGAGTLALAVGTGETRANAAAAVEASQRSEIADFYRAHGSLLWLSPRSGTAAQQLVTLLATAQADHLNPRKYNVKALSRALQ